MKKIIRNLLMGVTTSFWPVEKASAELSVLDFPEFFSAEKSQSESIVGNPHTNDLDKILNADCGSVQTLAGVDQVNELLRLIDEAQANDEYFSESDTNRASETVCSSSIFDRPLTNETIIVRQPMTNELNSVQKTNEVLSVSEPISTDISETTNTVAETNTMPVSAPVIQENTNTLKAVEQSVTQTVETESPSDTNPVVQPDLAELLSVLEEKKPVSTKPNTTPIKERGWFSHIFSAFMIGALISAVWLANKFDNHARKKRLQKIKEADNMTAQIVGEVKKAVPVVSSEKTDLPQEKPIQPVKKTVRKPRKIKQESIFVNLSEDEAHQKGVRMLANIKARRLVINRKMKALRTEITRYHQSDPRFLEISNEMATLQEERNQLTREHRQARILVKGVAGERIKEERRLVAKEIRLAKKSNDRERFSDALSRRLALNNQEKELVKAAETKAKKRMTTADWWHGKRLYQEALAQEKQLNDRIRHLKKETGLKKAEILQLEDEIRENFTKVRKQKSLAVRKMKGRQFSAQKRLLARQIIASHRLADSYAENQLKEELKALKTKEKEYVTWAKDFDYAKGRRSIVPPSVQLHAERRDRANAWKGYRMLRDLNQGLVNADISRETYQAHAYALIGKGYDASFNYEAERVATLKPTTLASIYLSRRKRGLI